MKKAMAAVMCAAMILTALVVSPTPVAASGYEADSLEITGAEVDYIAMAGYSGGDIYGYISASLKSSFWSSASLIIGAGVRFTGYTFVKDTAYLECSGAWGSDSDSVWQEATYGGSEMDIGLRVVLLAKILGVWPVAGARCWTWQYNDSSLTRDTAAETTWKNYAKSFGIVMALANFMGPYF